MKTLIAASIITTMAFATNMAFATVSTNYLPFVPVTFSGTITYQSSTNISGTTSSGTVNTVSINNKSLIALLNASSTVQDDLMYWGLPNQIPSGSYFVYDIDDEELIITNKNGFSFPLEGYGYYGYYDFAELDFDHESLFGSCSLNTTTGAGTEQDQVDSYFYFEDYNNNSIDTEYGSGTLNWTFGATYGATNNPVQKASVNLKFQPAAEYAEVDGSDNAITKGLTISGSGSSIIYALGEPFYLWW